MKLPLQSRQASSLRRRLLEFYDRRGRDLPWRQTSDPYAILVSEVMLQQTTVAAVIPFYHRFMAAFPSLKSLAAASEQDVLTRWSGLGYYRRARFLHQACRQVVAEHDGRLPDSVAALRRLPGIGAYTAGAVASIAFGRTEPVLDGNVVRVLSRLAARPGRGAGEGAMLEQAARALVHGERPGDLNQALMELGATVCTPRQPLCRGCPVSRSCSGFRQGAAERYPAPRPRPNLKPRQGVALVIRDRRNRVLLVQRNEGDLMPGLWELPGVSGHERQPEDVSPRAVLRKVARDVGAPVAMGPQLGTFQHTVVDRRVTVVIHEASLKPGSPRQRGGRLAKFIVPRGQVRLPLTAASRKALARAFPAVMDPVGRQG